MQTLALFELAILCLEFPPYSPDLNPIENLWDNISKRINLNNCKTLEQLQDEVAQVWAATDKNFCKVVESMPARCQAVIDANGNHTMY